MDRYFEVNKEHWNAATPLHLGPGEVYDIEGFKKGALSLLPIERAELGDVTGKRLLHAQCHIGVDTMSWARLGAQATGVDFSDEAIKAAQHLNDECGLDCRFICCNIYDLPHYLDEEFDIVYASYGVLCWLPDVPEWCRILASYLRSGGVFLLIEGHPFAECIDLKAPDGKPTVHSCYFTTGEPVYYPVENDDWDYHATDTGAGKPQYELRHTLGEIVTAMADAGLRIVSLKEGPEGFFRLCDDMEKGEDGLFRLPKEKRLVPLHFALKAVKE